MVVQEGDAVPELDRMIDMAWRRAARAMRAGHAHETERWLVVHASLTAMPRPAPRDPAPTPADEGPDPQSQGAAEVRSAAPGGSEELHQLHQLHRCIGAAPTKTPQSAPDPPP